MALDFLVIKQEMTKNGTIKVWPDYEAIKSKDLMIQGHYFYAIYDQEKGLWSDDEFEAIRLIDEELDKYANELRKQYNCPVNVQHLRTTSNKMIDAWLKFCKVQMPDLWNQLDATLVFSNQTAKKSDYVSKLMKYPLQEGPMSSYDKLMSVLYSPEERHKIEWSFGSIITGGSKKNQKFMVLYGPPGSGKGTVIKIAEQLFADHYTTFSAKTLTSGGSFPLESLRSNPLVAIQHDGDLSKIKDNTELNTVVSHEKTTLNVKYRSPYMAKFNCFLIMGSNSPVAITDAKSGVLRRLIDVSPTGMKIPTAEYDNLLAQIEFELSGIAWHCKKVYEEDPHFYDSYTPYKMLGATNDFYNFMLENYHIFKRDDGVTKRAAWDLYKIYCEDAKVPFPMSQRVFAEELRAYFDEYSERYSKEDGSRPRSYYHGFKAYKFDVGDDEAGTDKVQSSDIPSWLVFDSDESVFTEMYKDCPAQYASEEGLPITKWDNVKTCLSDLDQHKLHFARLPVQHIFLDFDIPDENGNKNRLNNILAASQFPETYAELSKSGEGIHLHYIWTGGDATKLSRVYGEHIEVKVCDGKSSARRKFTASNGRPIAELNCGLALKEEKKVLNKTAVQTEKGLRTSILKALNKDVEGLPSTVQNISWIKELLDRAYNSGLKYDVSNMKQAVITFANQSTHNASKCLEMIPKMHFYSDEPSEESFYEPSELIFFDCEVFPNCFILCWKKAGEKNPVIKMINPSPQETREWIDMLEYKNYGAIGHNCKKYDNIIIGARSIGYDFMDLFKLSQRIVSGAKDASKGFREYERISYTDTLDYASASEKRGLKKWEIKLHIPHKECPLEWDQPVPDDKIAMVADYCANDVMATEKVHEALKGDFTARKTLAKLAGMTPNDSTNNLTTAIIFGNDKNPQVQFNYRNMGDVARAIPFDIVNEDPWGPFDGFTIFEDYNKPIFPGYVFDGKNSYYRDSEPIGEGGYVYAEPGVYTDIALLDIASMHPSSIEAEELFGPKYTKRFSEVKQARIAIKHTDFDTARTMLDGKLAEFLTDESMADDLAQALKTAINSVYGLTAAKFKNKFKDDRNIDNIVAKRGALFMVNLKYEVQSRGYTVVHIKTDSIKIANADNNIIEFVKFYGQMYGYTFEHEATYEKMAIVNDAVYIAKYATVEKCKDLYGTEYVDSEKDICKNNKKHPGEWTATGTQFAVPYLFKTLFSHEPIEFYDFCETKSVTTAMYLRSTVDPTNLEFIGKVGEFCPVKPGQGGKDLVRKSTDKNGNVKYDAVGGTKGHLWLESDTIKNLPNWEDVIDKSYYTKLVDAAVEDISKYTDFEWFVS